MSRYDQYTDELDTMIAQVREMTRDIRAMIEQSDRILGTAAATERFTCEPSTCRK